MANWIRIETRQPTAGPFDLPWLPLVDMVENFNWLRITAQGMWTPFPGVALTCRPDGYGGFQLANSALVLANCPMGALIGKFGGSSAHAEPAKVADGQAADDEAVATSSVFAIGSHCVLKLPTKPHGPLFIGFNLHSRPIEINNLTITVEGTTLGTT
ncbi:hypothetical protein [Polymorphobacter fuscus]|uniref:Uncharacterized protein n=1 Tax=Sandarakinorhabdus fusca TaxID=1439888 RepID=A0A7C9L012_9SPHN|nr:hypothetical protein [Polymorphobacter fuscus]KAB7643925.1 hypothetical protein F9290_15350 [Polymorphobacter fuscus]MQT18628.1 hypothetical protein [Polymorphobacter fuscus]NJC07004.1 hypothetical protein [Polymorphobacter fuscus]